MFARAATVLGLSVLFSALAPAVADASPLELYSFGGRSSGMAGAGVATAHSFDCVYLNPAGLGAIRHKYLAGGLSYGALKLKLNGEASAGEDTIAVTFGMVVPLALKGRLRDRLTLGLGILVPQRALVRARAPEIGEPTFALLDSRSEVIGIQVALGYVINSRWSVGAGVLALGTLVGAIRVDVDGAGRFITRSEQELRSDFAPVLGVRYADPRSRYRVGVSARGASSAGYDIEVTNSLGMSLPLALPTFSLAGVPQYDPASLAAELAYALSPSIGASLQLEYKRWSAYPLPTENPLERGDKLPGADFSDTVVPRASVEWIAQYGTTELALRGGYAFLYSPAPEMTGAQSLVDNHRHQLALGLGLGFLETDFPFQFDAWVQVHELVSRSHRKEAGFLREGLDATIRGTGRIVISGVTIGVQL